MKIVVAHNYYGAKAFGGESTVFHQEVELLRRFGHEVVTLEHENAEIRQYPTMRKLTAPFCFHFSSDVYHESVALFRRFRPDVLHVHNYKYVITPSIFQAARDCGVKTVLTLHNYRLICPGGQLFRGSSPCEECLNHSPVRFLWRQGCASKLSSRFLQYAFFLETRRPILELVDTFIALTEFAKSKFIEGGVPESKIVVKPNFVPNPFVIGEGTKLKNSGAVFVGRASSEKGIRFLLDAWHDIDCPLTIVGSGPEEEWIRRHASSDVRVYGAMSHEETLQIMSGAEFLVFPSLWYEGLPMTLLEACALGKPIIASRLGARSEVVRDGLSGFLYDLGDRNRFIESVRKLHADVILRDKLGRGARAVYEESFTPEKNIAMLNGIYSRLLDGSVAS